MPTPLSPDTEPWAEELLFEHWRSLPTWEKAAIVTDLCRAADELCRAGLRLEHPGASDEELRLRAACRRLGRATVEATLGHPLPFADEMG